MRILAKTRTLIVFDLEKDECKDVTVADLKLRLENLPSVKIIANEQCLRYNGAFLSDEMLLNDVLSTQKSLFFFLTRLEPNKAENEPSDEDGAVGGATVTSKSNGDNKSILTDSELTDLTLVPDFDFGADDEGTAGVFDEDMELPPDLQQYYPNTVSIDEELVGKLVAMGYEEVDVRVALQASFNDAERAVEYLIDGIPKSLRSTLPDMCDVGSSRTPPPSYSGSLCSGCSMVPTPPTPHSPDISMNLLNENLAHCQNVESSTETKSRALSETECYDTNDEADKDCDKLCSRKHKPGYEFKKQSIEIWAAKATIATAASNIAQAHANADETDQTAADLLRKINYKSPNEVSIVEFSADELTCESSKPKI